MLRIRPATIGDVPLLRTMIRDLAEFERELEHVTIREEDLERDGFGPNPAFRALIAEWEDQPAAYALFYNYYSTWAGRGIYLEDLFVREPFRRHGIGKALLAEVAHVAVAEQCCRMRWEVLHWNSKAIALYEALGSEFLDEWRTMVLSGDALQRLAEKKL